MLKRSLTAVLVAATATIAACSNDPGENTTAPTTNATTTSTVVAPSTTPPPTTATTAEPTTTLTDEEAVRQVHTRFMTELFARDERIDGPEVVLPLAEELTTGAQLARIKEDVERLLETGERVVSPGFDSNIVDVLIDGDRASVLDCSKDQGELHDSDGTLISVSTGTFKMRETRLVRNGGSWLVEEFVGGGAVPCDPEA